MTKYYIKGLNGVKFFRSDTFKDKRCGTFKQLRQKVLKSSNKS